MYLFTSPKNKNLTAEICEVFVTSLFSIPVIYQEKICGEWVQTRGYQACVFCKLIPLRVCLSESAHLMQTFLKNLRPPKTRLPPNPLLFPYHIIQIIFHCHNFFHRHALKDRHPHFVFNPKERVDTKNQKGNSGYAPDLSLIHI